MTLPTIPGVTKFFSLPAGNESLSLFDASFNAVGAYINGVAYNASNSPGIDPTGNIECSDAINTAISAASSAGVKIVLTGTFLIAKTVKIISPADFSQAIFNVSGAPSIAVEVSTANASNPTTILQNITVVLPNQINNLAKPATGWAGQGVGVRLVNLYSCRLFFGEIKNFATNLLLTSYGGNGTVYNEFHLGSLTNGNVNLHCIPGDSTFWVNEDNFYGGRFYQYSGEGSNVSGCYDVYIEGATLGCNNLNFIKPSFEGDVPQYHVRSQGTACRMTQARWEATTPKVHYEDAGNANFACNNVIDGGYGVDNIVYTYTLSAGGGAKNQTRGFASDYRSFDGNGVFWQNENATGSPVYNIFPAGTKPETASIGAYCVSHSGASLLGKATGDAYPRINLDYTNGYLWMGKGVAAPTDYFLSFGAGTLGVVAASAFIPYPDDTMTLGTGTYRWSTVYAATGTINTSDETEKQDIVPIPDAVLDAWATVDFVSFKWKSSVAKKGEQARIHFGLIAQRIQNAFESKGIDAFQYGLLCRDAWAANTDVAKGPVCAAGVRMGVRMDQCMVLEAALMRREFENLKQK